MIQVQTELLVADNTGAKKLNVSKFWEALKEDMQVLEIQLLLQ